MAETGLGEYLEMDRSRIVQGETTSARSRPPWLLMARVVLVPVLLILSFFYSYFTLFNTFMPWDDEGCLMMTVKHFVDGYPLYDDVLTPYGPFFFFIKYIIHIIININISNTNTRWISLFAWMATAGLTSFCTWRLTRRASLSIVVYVLTLLHLSTISDGPGHPQELCGILLALCVMVPLWGDRGGSRRLAIGAGAIVAALALTKVNVGAFATLSILLALSIAAGDGRAIRAARALASAAAVLLPLLLIRPHLRPYWKSYYASIVILSVVALLIAARDEARPPVKLGVPHFFYFFASSIAVTILMLLFVLATGTSIHGLLSGLILTPKGLAMSFGWPLSVSRLGPVCATLGLVLAVMHARLVRSKGPYEEAHERAIAALKILFGLGVFASACLDRPMHLLNFGAPFLWLALTPFPAPTRDPDSTFSRLVLCLVAALQPLQAYPVPGSQVFFGTFLVIPVAAVCLGDAFTWMNEKYGHISVFSIPLRIGLPLIAASAIVACAWRDYESFVSYREAMALDERGTERIRLDERRVATFRWLVANLDHSADTFLCNIGFNSLFFWTGKEPPSRIVIGNYVDPYKIKAQEELVESLSRHPGACIVYHEPLFGLVNGPEEGKSSLFLDHIRDEFASCGRVDGFEFRVRKGRPEPRLVDCARWDDPEASRTGSGRAAVLDLAPAPGRVAERLCIYDLDRHRIVADSRSAGPEAALRVRDGDSGELALAEGSSRGGIDLTGPRHLTLAIRPTTGVARGAFLVVRLFDREGRLIKSVPFLETF